MVRQYQVVLDPDRLRAYGIPHAQRDRGGAERQPARPAARCSSWPRPSTWCARRGYLQIARRLPHDSAHDRATAACRCCSSDVARVQIGPEMRRGIAELDGEGEVAGGVIVMRSGKNALETIAAVKAKLADAASEPAAGRRDRRDLRPLGADRARGAQPARQAGRGVRRRRAGVRRSSCSTCARRSSRSSRCRSACWPRSSSCTTRASTPTSCRSAASRSRSARWWTRRW